MYHCHILFYLIGYQHKVFETVKEMSPLTHFSHEFLESDKPEEALAAKAISFWWMYRIWLRRKKCQCCLQRKKALRN